MSSFAIIAIIGGALILGGLYFWLKQAENIDDATSVPPINRSQITTRYDSCHRCNPTWASCSCERYCP